MTGDRFRRAGPVRAGSGRAGRDLIVAGSVRAGLDPIGPDRIETVRAGRSPVAGRRPAYQAAPVAGPVSQ
ncbi:hypothetical protein GCM10009787_22940 [Streptomyces bangladeshensis]|uniref:Uncharacterized protein n=1 Tax=Streptomyces bangladeshensis TaxID=295352 RepID=A0ABN3BH01_9ACTN